MNICRCRLLAYQICGWEAPGAEQQELGAAKVLLHLLVLSPACNPGATNPEGGEGWGVGGSLSYVLPVTEGAGQHTARVEPYAGLRRKMSQVTYTQNQGMSSNLT